MANEYYYELMDASELAFITKMVKQEQRMYRRIQTGLLTGCAVIAFFGGWKYLRREDVTIFSWQQYGFIFALLGLICIGAIRFSRSTSLTKLEKDLKNKTKMIEKVLIKKKTFLPHNNTFHFYLNSPRKLSIQVQEPDFNELSEGDEINIEYSTNAGVYFGYF
jgi:hypothetical protein